MADTGAAAARQIRDRLGATRAVGVGHSMGALFAVWQQARHKPYDGLVLLGFGVDGVHLDHALEHATAAKARRAGFATDAEVGAGGTATSDLLLAGMDVPENAFAALRQTASAMVPTGGIERLRRGAPELATIDTPDRSLFTLSGSGHNHNVAPNRHGVWDHTAEWSAARFT